MIDFCAFKFNLMASSMSLLASLLVLIAEVTAVLICVEVDSIPSVEGSGLGFFSVEAQPTTNIHINKGIYLTSISYHNSWNIQIIYCAKKFSAAALNP